jgi:hypothetical protein
MLKWQGVSYIISVQLTFHIAAVTMTVEFPTDKLYVCVCMLCVCVCVCVNAQYTSATPVTISRSMT